MKETELIRNIKKKKTLKGIPDEMVIKEMTNYKIMMKKKNHDYSDREVFKYVRKKLYDAYGSYQTNRKRKRNLYLEELKLAKKENGDRIKNSEEMKDIRRRILSTNVSTAERLSAGYALTYESVKKELDRPIRKVIDLGSGINPVAFCPTDFKDTQVLAYDINKEDIDFLNKYFKVIRLKGKAKILDLHDLEKVKKLPEADVILLFKVIDPIEKKGHEFSELLLKILKEKAMNIVVSFATKTLSNKPMNNPTRVWFERMTKRLGFKIIPVRTSNEVYYILKK